MNRFNSHYSTNLIIDFACTLNQLYYYQTLELEIKCSAYLLNVNLLYLSTIKGFMLSVSKTRKWQKFGFWRTFNPSQN